jgi:hypothetical protein
VRAREVAMRSARRAAKRGVNDDVLRLASVLADARFPARSWELIAHGEHRGADWKSRAELQSLPAGDYWDLAAVLVAVRTLREVEPPMPTPAVVEETTTLRESRRRREAELLRAADGVRAAPPRGRRQRSAQRELSA